MTWVQTIFHKLTAHMAELRGADFKIAFYLVSEVVTTGAAEVSISERGLSDATGISKSTIQVALQRLEASGLFLREAGGRARRDRFLLPAFRPADGGPISGTGVDRFPVQGGPISGTEVDRFPVQGGPISGTEVDRFPVQGGPETGTGVPEIGPPTYKERARAPVDSSSFVGSSISSIDRALNTRTLRPDQAEDSAVLRRHMRAFIVRVADASLDGKDIDDAIIAQCLAIAPVDALCNCLDDLRSRRVPAFQTLGWFVTAFLARFTGATPAQVKARRGALRVVPKPMNAEHRDPKFTRDVTQQLIDSAKGLG